MVDKDYWDKTKEKGDLGEEKFQKLLEERNLNIIHKAPIDSSFKEYDFKYINSSGKIKQAEVKTDSVVSDNLFIQVERNSKPSGLFLTKADFYVTYNVSDKLFYIIKSTELREAIIANSYKLKKNRKNTQEVVKGVIIPKSSFVKLPTAFTVRGRIKLRSVSSALDKSIQKRHPVLPLTIQAKQAKARAKSF